MKMLAHRHHAAPYGESHPVISVSVLLTALFLGAQGILFTMFSVAVPSSGAGVYRGANTFTLLSAITALLLLVFVAVDYRRNRIEAHGEKRFQTLVFAVAGIVLSTYLVFIGRVILLAAPPA